MNSNYFEKEKKKIITLFKQKNFTNVRKYGVKYLEQAPGDYEIIRILGITLIQTQNFFEAENYFKKLLFFEKNSDNYYTLGNIQKKINKFKDAIISFEHSLKINPNFSEAHNNLGNTKKY